MKEIVVDGSDLVIVAIVVFWLGNFLTEKIPLLGKYSIPIAVTGGLVCSIIVATIGGAGGPKITFDMQLRDTLLLVLFLSRVGKTIGWSSVTVRPTMRRAGAKFMCRRRSARVPWDPE